MHGLTRATTTLIAGGAAGVLIWLATQVNDKTEHINVKKISGGNTAHGSYNWVGISDSYFAAAFIPDRPDDLSVITLHSGLDIPDPSKPEQTKPVDVIGIAAGHPGQTSTRLFAGPKSVQVLESISVLLEVGPMPDIFLMLRPSALICRAETCSLPSKKPPSHLAPSILNENWMTTLISVTLREV